MTRRGRTSTTIMPIETLEYELYRVRQHAQYIAFVGLQQPLEDAVGVFRQAAQEITPKQCDLLGTIFHEVQRVVQQAITELESPDMALGARPYSTLLRLSAFHRTVVEGHVLIENAKGLCEVGLFGRDFTDAYGHLKHYLSMIIRSRREVLVQLGVQSTLVPFQDDTRRIRYA